MEAVNKTHFSIHKDTAYLVGEVFGYYLIPFTAFIAFVVNAFFSRIIINNRKFMKKLKYRLLMAKAVCVALVGKSLILIIYKTILRNFKTILTIVKRSICDWFSELAMYILSRTNFQYLLLPILWNCYYPLDMSSDLVSDCYAGDDHMLR